MEASATQGYLCGCPYDRDSSIWGFTLGSPTFGKLPSSSLCNERVQLGPLIVKVCMQEGLSSQTFLLGLLLAAHSAQTLIESSLNLLPCCSRIQSFNVESCERVQDDICNLPLCIFTSGRFLPSSSKYLNPALPGPLQSE